VPQTTPTPATLADLYQAEGKAELIAGKVVALIPTGARPGQIGGRIFRAIDDYAKYSLVENYVRLMADPNLSSSASDRTILVLIA
jgi:hypothetical protein